MADDDAKFLEVIIIRRDVIYSVDSTLENILLVINLVSYAVKTIVVLVSW